MHYRVSVMSTSKLSLYSRTRRCITEGGFSGDGSPKVGASRMPTIGDLVTTPNIVQSNMALIAASCTACVIATRHTPTSPQKVPPSPPSPPFLRSTHATSETDRESQQNPATNASPSF